MDMKDYANRPIRPLTLKAYIEEALREARTLGSQPDGPLYVHAGWEKAMQLQAIGVLGESKKVPGVQYHGPPWRNHPVTVYPVDAEKARYYSGKLSEHLVKLARQRWPQGRDGPHVSGIRIVVTPSELLQEYPLDA